jgi:hypothetical protein
MANLRAINSLIQSLADWLQSSYAQARRPVDQGGGGHNFLPENLRFAPVGSNALSTEALPDDAELGNERVTIYLYRVSIDPHLRSAGRTRSPEMKPTPLSVQLHLLFSFWSEDASDDHLAVTWLMRQLHVFPVLDAAALNTEAKWEADEVVHLIPAELSNEDMMRLWDALTPSYRLSVSYIARIVRIDPDESDEAGPVVARRLQFGEWKEERAL